MHPGQRTRPLKKARKLNGHLTSWLQHFISRDNRVTYLRHSRKEDMMFSDVFIQSWVLFSLIFIFENFFLLILFWVLLNSLLSFCFIDWFFFISPSLFSFILVYFEKNFFHYCSVAKSCLTHGLIVAGQAPLSSTIFWSLFKFMFI